MICAGRVPHMEEMRNAKKKFGQKTWREVTTQKT
jgi:hypothetical protein